MREKLPERRRSETLKFQHMNPDTGYPLHDFLATVGYYADGRPGEIFLDWKDSSAFLANLARDAALILSIAIQYGAPISVLQEAVSRTENGLPHTVIGTALDLLAGEAK